MSIVACELRIYGPPLKLLLNDFASNEFFVVTFFECESRPAKSLSISVSFQKWRVIFRCPGNVKKCPVIEGILLICTCSYREKFCHCPPPNRARLRKLRKFLLPPPPSEPGPLMDITENCGYYPLPQRTWSASVDT